MNFDAHAGPPRTGVALVAVPRSWAAVTPAWMTAALRPHHPRAVVSAVALGPSGDGTNAGATVHLAYTQGSGPASVFVKLPGRPAHRLALAALGAVYTEARLAASGQELPLEHPLFFAAGTDRRRLGAVVVMEDVVAGGAQPGDARRPLTAEQVRSGLDGLAWLHAGSWGRSLPAVQFLRAWRLTTAWAAVSVANLARGLRRVGALGVPVGMPRISATALGAQFRRWAVLAAAGPQTLLHGDPHPANTYATPDGRTGFYDWQLARTGHWSHDVGYFLAGSLDVADRRAHERSLLAGYLEALRRGGADAPGWDDAWARYRATPAFGLATWLHTLAFGSFQPADACAAMIGRYAAAYEDLGTARSIVAAGR